MNKSDQSKIKKLLPKLSASEKNQIKLIASRGFSQIPIWEEAEKSKSVHASNLHVPFNMRHPLRWISQ